jgi:hypothetical protein
MLSSELVPLSSFRNALVNIDADLVVVAHGKLARRQLLCGSTLGILVCELLVLLENTFVAKEKPSTDAQGSLGIALVGGQAIVVQRVRGVEFAAKLAEFVSLAHFVLCLGKAEVRRLLDVDKRRLGIGWQH